MTKYGSRRVRDQGQINEVVYAYGSTARQFVIATHHGNGTHRDDGLDIDRVVIKGQHCNADVELLTCEP